MLNKSHFPDDLFLVPDDLFLVPDDLFLVPDDLFLVPDDLCLVWIRNQVAKNCKSTTVVFCRFSVLQKCAAGEFSARPLRSFPLCSFGDE